MKTPVVDVSGWCRWFPGPEGRVRVLDGLDLRVERGAFVVILGPSGSGKSTLLHLLALLDRADAGRYCFEGADTSTLSERQAAGLRAERMGLVFQQFHLLPYRSVWENLCFRHRYTASRVDPGRARTLLEELGLASRARHAARLLSGGEKQRLCIGRALLLPPALLMADEPTGNLDAANRMVVRDLFLRVHRAGQTVLLATHDERWCELATQVLDLGAAS